MAINNTPSPRSRVQILSDMLDTFASKQGIQRLKVGSGILSILEAASQSDSKQIATVLQALQAQDLDAIQGLALDAYGSSQGLPRLQARVASSILTITDTSFQRRITKLSQAAPAPIAGSSVINVNRTLDWLAAPTSGSLYIGRGLPSYEGPLTYTSIADNGTYLAVTLSANTTLFHNQGESVVLSQGGDRTVNAGEQVQTAQGSLSSSVAYRTLYQYTLPDGENELNGVQVVCTLPGTLGNVPPNAIHQFSSPPFPGASVTNPSPIVDGRDTETDDDYRKRIKLVKGNPQRGVDAAIELAAVGLQDSLAETISAASLVRQKGYSVLYVDDGAGYEETSDGVGVEVLTNQAQGGETRFQTQFHQVAKAFVVSSELAPYVLADGAQLGVVVGGIFYWHTFSKNEFTQIANATAFEVVASINLDPRFPVSARTSGGGTLVVLESRSESNEDFGVLAVSDVFDANSQLRFPVSVCYTTSLYLNDVLLSKDGSLAVIESRPFGQWSQFTGPQTLTVGVDGTGPVTYQFLDQDFITANTGFNTVGKNSLAAWVAVLNSKVPGIAASVIGSRLKLVSNLGRIGRAQVEIFGGSLYEALVFDLVTSQGKPFDYSLDRATGDILLTSPLASGDRLTLGSAWTRPFESTGRLGVSLVPSSFDIWASLDSNASLVPEGVTTSTNLGVSVVGVTDSTFRLQLSSSASEAFSQVVKGDTLILDDQGIPAALEGAWRVSSANDTSVVIEKTGASGARRASSVVLLPIGDNGDVLIIGGKTAVFAGYNAPGAFFAGLGTTGLVERFSRLTHAWSTVAPLATPRSNHTATLLADGRVLVVGGLDSSGHSLASSEIYDPTSDTWVAGPGLTTPRSNHTATLLADGRVLIVGGFNSYGALIDVAHECVNTSEEFDPTLDEFNHQATMVLSRWDHAALRLSCVGGDTSKDGFVFVAGGYHQANFSGGVVANCEIYNPSSHTWVGRGSMPSARECFSIAQSDDLDPHRLLAIGASWQTPSQTTTYCIYNIDSNTWGADEPISIPDPVTFSSSRLGVLGAFGDTDHWALVAPYAMASDGSAVTLLYSGYSSDTWVPQPGSLYESVKQDVLAVEFGPNVGVNDRLLLLGGYWVDSTDFGTPTSTYEVFNPGDSTWTWPLDATDSPTFNLTNTSGLVVVRTQNPLARASFASGTYSAQTFVLALNSQIPGAVASVYRTSALRLATANYFGDLLLVSNTGPTYLPLSTGSLVTSQSASKPATVLSGATAYGTPFEFTAYTIDYTGPSINDSSVASIYIESGLVPLSTGTAIGLEMPSEGAVGRAANWAGYRSSLASAAAVGLVGSSYNVIELGLRDLTPTSPVSGEPIVIALPLQISPQDDLNVLVDQDTETGLFDIPLYRQVQAVPATSYSSTITVQETTGATLSSTFGLTYVYDDLAVFMKARVKTHSADSTRSVLWRYWRPGSDGERFCVRYALPAAANATTSVAVTHDQNTIDLYGAPRSTISITLGSGGAKTGSTIRATTRLGLTCTLNDLISGHASKAYFAVGFKVLSYHRDTIGGPTCLTLSIPPGVTSPGSNLNVGDVMWFDAVSPNHTTLWPGSFAIFQVDTYDDIAHTQNIWVGGGILDDGTATLTLTSNPGTVSTDPTSAVKFDPTIVVGDLVRLSSNYSNVQFTGETMQVTAVGDSNQWLICDFCNLQSASFSGALQYAVLGSPTYFQAFGGTSDTASAIVDAVNTLASAVNSSVPITGTVLGDGSGVISVPSWAEDNLQISHYQLTDGLNFVQKTTNPLVVSGATQLLLKNPVNSDLFTDSDWANENIWLVPQLPQSVVKWLNTPTITGLWSKAEVVNTASGQIQITSLGFGSSSGVEILGGLGNGSVGPVFGSLHPNTGVGVTSALITVRSSDTTSLVGGRYVRIDNGVKLSKKNIPAFQSGYALTSIVAATKTWVTSSPLYNQNPYLMADTQVEIQSVGRYTLLSFLTGTFQYSIIDQSGYVIISQPGVPAAGVSNVSQANCGTFRIVACNKVGPRIQVWIENPIVLAENSQANVHFIEFDSLVVGDSVTFETTSFGQNNRGTFVVTEVGNSGVWYFKTDLTPQNLTSPVVFSDSTLPLVLEGPSRSATKRVISVCPNQVDGSYADLLLEDTVGIKAVGQAVGSVVRALDKLDFPLGLNSGSDAYRYNTGLLGAASSVIYRDPQDGTGDTGYVAAGATILVAGPKVRRITVSLAIRAVNNSQSIIDQVQASVATFINSSPMGQPMAISDIVEAAKIGGVTAVSVIYPQFSSSNDVIPLGAYEKAMVLDVSRDISVVFVGE